MATRGAKKQTTRPALLRATTHPRPRALPIWPHLVVSNPRLMGNHQLELAEKLSRGKHLLHCLPSQLKEGIERIHGDEGAQLTPLPPGNPEEFARALDTVVSDIYCKD